MKTDLQMRVCDCCNKQAQLDKNNMPIGGHPFSGWFEVRKHGGSTMLSAFSEKSSWDFCSIGCLERLLLLEKTEKL